MVLPSGEETLLLPSPAPDDSPGSRRRRGSVRTIRPTLHSLRDREDRPLGSLGSFREDAKKEGSICYGTVDDDEETHGEARLERPKDLEGSAQEDCYELGGRRSPLLNRHWDDVRAATSQIPAIMLITIFHLMVGVPFGVSYFPIGWRSASQSTVDMDASEQEQISTGGFVMDGQFPIPGMSVLLAGALGFFIASSRADLAPKFNVVLIRQRGAWNKNVSSQHHHRVRQGRVVCACACANSYCADTCQKKTQAISVHMGEWLRQLHCFANGGERPILSDTCIHRRGGARVWERSLVNAVFLVRSVIDPSRPRILSSRQQRPWKNVSATFLQDVRCNRDLTATKLVLLSLTCTGWVHRWDRCLHRQDWS